MTSIGRRRAVAAFAARMLLWCAFLVVASLLLVLVALPRVTGSVALAVRSGSMEPAIQAGSVVVVRPVDVDSIAIGDVITFQLREGEAALVSHRVVGVSNQGGVPAYRTKGDANEAHDPNVVRPEQIRGAVWYDVPWVGGFTDRLRPDDREWIVRPAALGLLASGTWLVVTAATRIRRSRTATAVLLATLAFGAGIVRGPPAGAAAGLELSPDGTNWSTSFDGPLISPAAVVPAGSLSGVVHIRNATGRNAELGVAITGVEVPRLGDSAPSVDVSLWDGSDRIGSARHVLTGPGADRELGLGDVVGGDGVRRVDVTLSLPRDASNDSQSAPIAFDLRITLAGETVDIPSNGPDTDPPGGPVARTGSHADLMVVAAAALLALGAAARVAQRRG